MDGLILKLLSSLLSELRTNNLLFRIRNSSVLVNNAFRATLVLISPNNILFTSNSCSILLEPSLMIFFSLWVLKQVNALRGNLMLVRLKSNLYLCSSVIGALGLSSLFCFGFRKNMLLSRYLCIGFPKKEKKAATSQDETFINASKRPPISPSTSVKVYIDLL